ncbi:NO-inducible flavohemoprotein [Vibrio tritonius]|uniref:nitric oxide dioxygenase n=1 Tax=Vibrio tritonius TaxID=1435069 RepID=A0ABS7YJV3_9VIBR|nr:NO-inducible flavohemoprotein [Vibrio tritonius]MCA2014540.1 NO-inducible flavohemoprotein [Vibrio tritonius]
MNGSNNHRNYLLSEKGTDNELDLVSQKLLFDRNFNYQKRDIMNDLQKALVSNTVPVLRESGVALTSHFYHRMLTHNPELKHIFNQANQAQGAQQQALAMAVLAYADNINNPSVLLPVVERIAHKHTSLGIRAEQYSIVGKHLLGSIKEVLGDAASDELIDAWAAAYQQLADIFISVESGLYQNSVANNAGWSGWRPFKVTKKTQESSEISSFYLEPNDQGSLPHFKPGQYVSVRLYVEDKGIYQPRQYSLSQAPGKQTLRISIKRESDTADKPQGVISNLMHTQVEVGDVIDVSAPFGDFFLAEPLPRPIVMISGGVGITPMMSMSEHLDRINALSQAHFIHSAKNSRVHAFKDVTDDFASRGMKVNYFYDESANFQSDIQPGPFKLDDLLPEDPTRMDYYICGPRGFMKRYFEELRGLGVKEEHIHAETFGTGGF